MRHQATDAKDTAPTFISLPFSPSSTSSSLASEISFLSNTNFKRRLSSSGSQINFTPPLQHGDKRTRTATHKCLHHITRGEHGHALIKHTAEVIKKSSGMMAIISLVKYQGRLDSKIRSLLLAGYQYHSIERLRSSTELGCSSVLT